MEIRSGSTVSEIIQKYPQTVFVFFRYHMICVGCAMAKFDTLEDAAENYAIPLSQFLVELRREITQTEVGIG